MQFEKQEVSFLQKSLISSLFLLLIFSCVPTVTQGQGKIAKVMKFSNLQGFDRFHP